MFSPIDPKDSFFDIVKWAILEFEILSSFSQKDLDKKGTVITCVVQSNHFYGDLKSKDDEHLARSKQSPPCEPAKPLSQKIS